MTVRRLLVAGAGQMGSGIAQVAAQSGLGVLLYDVGQSFLDRGLAAISRFLDRGVELGKVTPEARAEALGRIEGILDIGRAAECDFVIEAVTEDLETKRRLLGALDGASRPEVILASNTSSLPITQLAACTRRPGQVVGMHFMNPVPLVKLVEVIRGLETSDATAAAAMELARTMGKTPVEVRDGPGFIVNRVLMPLLNEAMFCLYEGRASAEDIDTVMRLGAGHPMGPLALADMIGLDTVLSILGVLFESFGDPKYRACPLLRQMVHAGRLGRKSGHGFYHYD
jgi:3-hydroxybutyryl-CoA dehydrogenase